MNQNAFFDDLLLMYLFKKDTASTNDIENYFGDFSDGQNVNNIICNRGNSTSYINRGLIDYDEKTQTLSITAVGKQEIENRYSSRRSKMI